MTIDPKMRGLLLAAMSELQRLRPGHSDDGEFKSFRGLAALLDIADAYAILTGTEIDVKAPLAEPEVHRGFDRFHTMIKRFEALLGR
jgi:hypothetical protein